MLDTEPQCYHFVGDEDDEPVTDHDLLQSVALGLKLPRLIRSNLKFMSIEGRPKIWPVLEQPPES